jgi:hypothetical protein
MWTVSPSEPLQKHKASVSLSHSPPWTSAPPLAVAGPRRPPLPRCPPPQPRFLIPGWFPRRRHIPGLPPSGISLTLATGLLAGVEDDGARPHAARLAYGWDLLLLYIVNLVDGHAWLSPAASKVSTVRCSAVVFAGSHGGREAVDTAVCAPPSTRHIWRRLSHPSGQAPPPTPHFRSTTLGREAMDAAVSAGSQGRAGRVLDMQELASKPPRQGLSSAGHRRRQGQFFSCLRSSRFLARYPIPNRHDTKVTDLEQLAGMGAWVNNLPASCSSSCLHSGAIITFYSCVPPVLISLSSRQVGQPLPHVAFLSPLVAVLLCIDARHTDV